MVSNRSKKTWGAYSLILTAVFVFWYIAGHPRMVREPALSVDHKLQSVSYAPFEKNQSPLDVGSKGLKISDQRIDADLAILSRRFDCIRTYSVAGLEAVPAYAEKYGLKVLLGAWISSDPVLSQKEVTSVIALAKRYPAVIRGIVVGNEVLLRREVTDAELVGYIRQVKSALPDIPVTYADVWEFWLKHPDVAPAVDFVLIHILPYWEDDPVAIDQTMAHVQKIREKLASKIPDKEIIIGETGWPSEGRMREGALPSRVNQARFMRGFVALAEQEKWQYNLIEAFDQPWKRVKEGAVGGHWGLYDTDRNDKSVFSGPVSDYPDWPIWLAISAAMVLLTLPLVGRSAGMTGMQWMTFSGVAGVGAILIALQAHQFSIISRDGWEYLWAAMVLVQAVIVYFLMLSAIALNYRPQHLALNDAVALLRRGPRLSAGDSRWQSPDVSHFFPSVVQQCLFPVIAVNRLVVVTFFLIASAGLVFDARYRSFNNCGFFLSAVGYGWFSLLERRSVHPDGLERLCAITLFAAAIGILFNETPRNLQADAWVGICALMAVQLWREGKGASLRPLISDGLILAATYTVFAVMRYVILDSNMVMNLCTENPDGPACIMRTFMGKLMHYQVFGISSLVMMGLAAWRNTERLYLMVLIVSLSGLVYFNVGMAAIALVVAGLMLAHRKI